MLRRYNLRISLAVCLGLVAAGLHISVAEEKVAQNLRSASAQARLDAARDVYKGAWERRIQEPESVVSDIGYFHKWSVRWLQAERDLDQTKAGQVRALEGHLKRMQVWKESLEKMVKDGQAPRYEVSAAEYFRIEAEDWLADAKASGK